MQSSVITHWFISYSFIFESKEIDIIKNQELLQIWAFLVKEWAKVFVVLLLYINLI